MLKMSHDIKQAPPHNYIHSTSFQQETKHEGLSEKQGLVYTCGIYFKETNTKAQRAEDEVDHLSTGVCLGIEKEASKTIQ